MRSILVGRGPSGWVDLQSTHRWEIICHPLLLKTSQLFVPNHVGKLLIVLCTKFISLACPCYLFPWCLVPGTLCEGKKAGQRLLLHKVVIKQHLWPQAGLHTCQPEAWATPVKLWTQNHVQIPLQKSGPSSCFFRDTCILWFLAGQFYLDPQTLHYLPAKWTN